MFEPAHSNMTAHWRFRQATAALLKTARSKKTHARRARPAETPNAVIEKVMVLRRFLLRGLGEVRTEWLRVRTAFNLRTPVAVAGAPRAKPALKSV